MDKGDDFGRSLAVSGDTVGQYFCSGFIWGENVGWIQLGDGTPADGVLYSNTDSAEMLV